ncbi:MAG TPA: hypothetical protein VK571_08610 [Gemmatimonadaceae bacterium]|nr:hypothetical protein [Gemmatimonadaceae bacterium]
MQQANGRIATLDGVRAVSICVVPCAHSLGTGILPMLAVVQAVRRLERDLDLRKRRSRGSCQVVPATANSARHTRHR